MLDRAEIGSGDVLVSPTWDADDWRRVDLVLRGIAQRRALLDSEEAHWLREAERLRIWKPLGMVSALDYCERVLGYTPHVANERLRVAKALGELPIITGALEAGRLSYSAVRELTRVATPATEVAWCAAVEGKNVRQVEELVAGRKLGDQPDTPADSNLRKHVVRFEVGAEVFARLRQTRAALADEHGAHLDDDQFVTMLCEAALEGAPEEDGEASGRAKFQIALSVCPRCDQGSQDAAGVVVAVDAATVERARCDAQHLGSIDGDAPERATQDVPPSIVRFVWRRDHGRCQTPGCRSARGLEIHHLVRRVDGGTHDAANLTLRCSSCHIAHHRGQLSITGAYPNVMTVRPSEPVMHRAATKLDIAMLTAQARDALVGLGWKSATARRAVEEAWSHVGPNVELEELFRAALARCPRPLTE